jgi:glycolate oxidase iron-sulfur subunit
VRDPLRFLVEHGERLRFRALHARIALHLPCTQRNVVREPHAASAMLARISGLEVTLVSAPGGCCGAAGLHFVQHPQVADRMLAPLIEQLARTAPDFVLSGNIGCRLHLEGGLRRAGIKVPVLHPLSLLAQQLEPA